MESLSLCRFEAGDGRWRERVDAERVRNTSRPRVPPCHPLRDERSRSQIPPDAIPIHGIYAIEAIAAQEGLAAAFELAAARWPVLTIQRPLSAANSATLLAMRAAHSMVPAATLRPDE